MWSSGWRTWSCSSVGSRISFMRWRLRWASLWVELQLLIRSWWVWIPQRSPSWIRMISVTNSKPRSTYRNTSWLRSTSVRCRIISVWGWISISRTRIRGRPSCLMRAKWWWMLKRIRSIEGMVCWLIYIYRYLDSEAETIDEPHRYHQRSATLSYIIGLWEGTIHQLEGYLPPNLYAVGSSIYH